MRPVFPVRAFTTYWRSDLRESSVEIAFRRDWDLQPLRRFLLRLALIDHNREGTPVRGYELKLERADVHLGATKAAIQRFFEDDPCNFVYECDVKTREYVVRFRVFREPPLEIASLAADCFHNLRQALDHIAYRLAITISGCDPPPNEKGIYFPIADNATSFEGKLACFGSPKKITPEIRTVLEQVQSYERRDAVDLLPFLEHLDNLDKHRFPPLIAMGGILQSVQIGELRVHSMQGPRFGYMEDQTEIMRFTPVKDSAMEINLPASTGVAFAEGKPGPVELQSLLIAIKNLIRDGVAAPLSDFLA